MRTEPLLSIRNLDTRFFTEDGVIHAVDDVSLDVMPGRTLCILGESGCGKSVMARSVLQIVDPPGRVVGGSILWRGRNGQVVDLAGLKPASRAIRKVRGAEISMIFQEPMSSLGPVQKVGRQIEETIRLHRDVTKAEARELAAELLDKVRIPDPRARLESYPFELSGGMRQRVMIAMALSCQPRLLIADEPTTALDVTTQAEILDLLAELQEEFGMAVMLITHDLGVVAEVADDVAVMYLGKVVETGDVASIFETPQHPYTRALMASIPRIGHRNGARLPAIEGMVPHPLARPRGCAFQPRCPERIGPICIERTPRLIRFGETGQCARCFLHEQVETDG